MIIISLVELFYWVTSSSNMVILVDKVQSGDVKLGRYIMRIL